MFNTFCYERPDSCCHDTCASTHGVIAYVTAPDVDIKSGGRAGRKHSSASSSWTEINKHSIRSGWCVCVDHGPDLLGSHRRDAPVLLRQLRHHPDQPLRADLHALHRRHRTRIPLQQGGEPAVQRGAGPRDADRQTHGARRQLQELQQQAGLDLRVRHRGQPAL